MRKTPHHSQTIIIIHRNRCKLSVDSIMWYKSVSAPKIVNANLPTLHIFVCTNMASYNLKFFVTLINFNYIISLIIDPVDLSSDTIGGLREFFCQIFRSIVRS